MTVSCYILKKIWTDVLGQSSTPLQTPHSTHPPNILPWSLTDWWWKFLVSLESCKLGWWGLLWLCHCWLHVVKWLEALNGTWQGWSWQGLKFFSSNNYPSPLWHREYELALIICLTTLRSEMPGIEDHWFTFSTTHALLWWVLPR